MRIRFQADEDLNEVLIKALLRREPTIDFQTARTAKLTGLDDRAVLTLAGTSERLLVTHDRKTMPAQFASFIAGHGSAGVLVVPQAMPVMQVVEELILIWAAADAEEWVNRICVLPM